MQLEQARHDHSHSQQGVALDARSETFNCFGCSPQNSNGLALEMCQLGVDTLVSTFCLPRQFESYPGVIHGGIVSTVLDEVMGNLIAALDKRLCFTMALRLKYLSPIHTDHAYRCVARLTRRPDSTDGIYKVDGEIHPLAKEELLVAASATYKWITTAQVATEMTVKPSALGKYVDYVKPAEQHTVL